MKYGNSSSYIAQRSCAPCQHGRPLFWIIAGVVGGLYWLGKRKRPAERQASVEAIDEPEVSEAWQRLSNRLPQFRVMWKYLIRQGLTGRSQVRVLDIGSGAGQLINRMAQRPEVTRAVGIDLSNEMIKRARQQAEEHGIDAEFLQVDAAEMPFEDASFDLVVSTVSMHHWENPGKVMQEIRRVLTPAGRAILFDLRRDASPVFWGVATLITRYIVPGAIRNANEPLASFKAAYTPCEVVLMAYKAGWEKPRVKKGPIWMVAELDKAA